MRILEPKAISILILSSFFFSSQIETIDDPVPAVEAILRRCNKHQVLKITLVYNEGHVRVLCTSTSDQAVRTRFHSKVFLVKEESLM